MTMKPNTPAIEDFSIWWRWSSLQRSLAGLHRLAGPDQNPPPPSGCSKAKKLTMNPNFLQFVLQNPKKSANHLGTFSDIQSLSAMRPLSDRFKIGWHSMQIETTPRFDNLAWNVMADQARQTFGRFH